MDSSTADNVIPFPRPSDRITSLSAEEQHELMAALAHRIARSLHAEGWAKVAANTAAERGFIHEAALVAGTKLDRPIATRTTQDHAVLIVIDEEASPLRQQLDNARLRHIMDEAFGPPQNQQ